ncbi:hypothetical protein [Deinococcus sp. Leaf326]|uniref:hypothetical protein n=1 Tax=Deinococcus sp. Leaf326 TaxID=1736338 RepID=UPI0012E1E277|nr:hypothetical protein [Deinococcus sp. Leaf326]
MAAEMPVWDDRGFHINAVTNLMAVYLKQNPGLSHASASRRAESFLGMPLPDGQYVPVGSHVFSHHEFVSAAGNNLNAFTQQLADEMQGGTAQHLFRAQSVSATPPVLGAVSTDMVANIAADAAKGLATVGGGPLAAFGVTSILQLTGFSSFFNDKTANQLKEISNQLKEIKTQLVELNSKVDALKSEVDALGKKVDLADYHSNMAQLDVYISQIHTSYLTLIQLNEILIERASEANPETQLLLDKQLQQYRARLKNDNVTLSAALLYLPEHPSQDDAVLNKNNFSGFTNKLMGSEVIGIAGLIPQWSKIVRGNSKIFYTPKEARLIQQQWDYLDHVLAEGMTLKINMLVGMDQPAIAQDSFRAWMQERTYLYSQVRGGDIKPDSLKLPVVDSIFSTVKDVEYIATPHVLPKNTVIDQEWKTDKNRPGYTMYRTVSDGQSLALPNYILDGNNPPLINKDMSQINQVYTMARANAMKETALSNWFLPDTMFHDQNLDNPLPVYTTGSSDCRDSGQMNAFKEEYNLRFRNPPSYLPDGRDLSDLSRKLRDAGGIQAVGFASQGKTLASGLYCLGTSSIGEPSIEFPIPEIPINPKAIAPSRVFTNYDYNNMQRWDSLGILVGGRNVLDGQTGSEKVIQYNTTPYGNIDLNDAVFMGGVNPTYKTYISYSKNFNLVVPPNSLQSDDLMDFFMMRRTNGIDGDQKYYWY